MKLLFDIAALALIVVALSRIVATPAARWAHGRISIVAWIVAVLWCTVVVHGVILPLAAVAAIWHTGRINRPVDLAPRVPDLPYAEGQPDEDSAAEHSDVAASGGRS